MSAVLPVRQSLVENALHRFFEVLLLDALATMIPDELRYQG
jgi:hypothetical protein